MKKYKRKIKKTSGIIARRMSAEIKRGNKILDRNKAILGLGFVPPDPYHYGYARFRWDGEKTAYRYAVGGDPDSARNEIEGLLNTMDPETGFIPNMTFVKWQWNNPEKWLVFGLFAKSSDYSQPPLTAMAVDRIFEAYKEQGRTNEANEFLKNNYNNLAKSYRYFHNRQEERNLRDGTETELPVLKDLHEMGRDSDHVGDHFKLRISNKLAVGPLNWPLRRMNGFLDYSSELFMGVRRRLGISNFSFTDVMFSCIYAENLAYMERLSKETGHIDDALEFGQRSKAVEIEILDKMWDARDGFFYPLDKGKQIKKPSIGGLLALSLDTLKLPQARALHGKIKSKEWFGTEYPLPSIPTHHENYDPSFQEPRIWRGPVWVNMNWFVVRGLRKQAEKFRDEDPKFYTESMDSADRIAQKTKEMVAKSGYREFYHPDTGEALRKRINNFAWSTLADIIELEN